MYDFPGECWNFTGCTLLGYGKVQIMGKLKGAHILSCEITAKRAIKPGEVTRHLCGNKLCIAPHHLRFGTSQENTRDSLKNGIGCKLNESNVREIRVSPLSDKELSELYNVTPITI